VRIRVIILNARLVLETLHPLEEDRKCWRLLNGILIEKKKVDLEPDLKLHIQNMEAVIKNLESKAGECLKQMHMLQNQ